MPIISENREFSRLTYGEQGVKFFCFLTWHRAGLGPCSHILPISHHSRTCAHFRLQKEQNKCGRVTISLPTSIYTFAHPMGCTCTHAHTDCQNGSLENARFCNFQLDHHDGPTDIPTNQRTNKVSYWVACPLLKSNIAPELSKTFHAIKSMLIT